MPDSGLKAPPARPQTVLMRRAGQQATSSVLRTLLRRRGFSTMEEVAGWSRREHADSRYHLYAGIFSRIDRGKAPTVYRLEALRAATGLSRRDLYALAGIDLDLLPLHSSLLNIERTRPVQSMTCSSDRMISLPSRFHPISTPAVTMPLSEVVAGWSAQPQRMLEEWRHDSAPPCRYVQVGLADGKSYPEIVPGMVVQVDPRGPFDVQDGGLYAFEHPYGYSVCRAAVEDDDTVVLLSSSRGLYPELRFPRGLVRVLGRARACCGRIVGIRVPSVIREADLRRVYRDDPARSALVPPSTALNRSSASELLRVQRHRLGISYEEFATMSRRLREVAGPQFGVSAARLHEIVHGRPTVIERPAVVYALAACLALEYDDVLAGLGIDVRESHDAERILGEREESARRPRQLPREQAFVADLLARWLELPPLLSVLGPDVRTSSIFYFNQAIGSIEPLIKPHSFLLIDGSKTIVTVNDGRSVAELPEWERPIYLLLTRQGYVCGYCERDEKTVSIVAHPRAADQRRRTFPAPEVDVVGRVGGVATLLQ